MLASKKFVAKERPGRLPLLVLGISGVIVLDQEPEVPVTQHHVSAWSRWARNIMIPDAAVSVLHDLRSRFEIVWASEWGHNAHTALRLALDLPEEPWPFLPVQFNKLDSIRSYAAGSPWVWIDEEFTDLSGRPEVTDGLIIRTHSGKGVAGINAEKLQHRFEVLVAQMAQEA